MTTGTETPRCPKCKNAHLSREPDDLGATLTCRRCGACIYQDKLGNPVDVNPHRPSTQEGQPEGRPKNPRMPSSHASQNLPPGGNVSLQNTGATSGKIPNAAPPPTTGTSRFPRPVLPTPGDTPDAPAAGDEEEPESEEPATTGPSGDEHGDTTERDEQDRTDRDSPPDPTRITGPGEPTPAPGEDDTAQTQRSTMLQTPKAHPGLPDNEAPETTEPTGPDPSTTEAPETQAENRDTALAETHQDGEKTAPAAEITLEPAGDESPDTPSQDSLQLRRENPVQADQTRGTCSDEQKAKAVELYYGGESKTTIVRTLKRDHGAPEVHPSTVNNWVAKYTSAARRATIGLKPRAGGEWIAANHRMRMMRQTMNILTVVHLDSGYILATMPAWDTKQAAMVIAQALRGSEVRPERIHLDQTFNNHRHSITRHPDIQGLPIKTHPNGNIPPCPQLTKFAELAETIKTKARQRTDNNLGTYLENLAMHLNFLDPESRGELGQSPAQAAGIEAPVSTWMEVTTLPNLPGEPTPAVTRTTQTHTDHREDPSTGREPGGPRPYTEEFHENLEGLHQRLTKRKDDLFREYEKVSQDVEAVDRVIQLVPPAPANRNSHT